MYPFFFLYYVVQNQSEHLEKVIMQIICSLYTVFVSSPSPTVDKYTEE